MAFLCCAAGAFVETFELSSDAMRLHRAMSSLNAEVTCARYNHNGKIIASCSVDGGICLDVAASGELLSRFFYPARAITDRRVNAVHFSSGSRFLASGGSDGCVRVWDLKTQEVTQTYSISASAVTSVAFSGYKDDFIVAGSESGAISVCDVQSAETIGFLSVDPKFAVAGVTSVVASPHPYARQILGSTYADGSVRVWDLHVDQLAVEFANQHDAPATCLAISPVSKVLLASGGLDRRVLFFDTLQRRELRSMDLDAPVSALALCADGKTLAVGTTSGDVLVYDLRGAITPLHAGKVSDGASGGVSSAVKSLQFATPSSDNSNATVFPTSQPVIATERMRLGYHSPTKQQPVKGVLSPSPTQSSTMQIFESAHQPETPSLLSPSPAKSSATRQSGFTIAVQQQQQTEGVIATEPPPPSSSSSTNQLLSELAILRQQEEELRHPPSLLNTFQHSSPTRLGESPSRHGEPSLLSMLAEPSPTRPPPQQSASDATVMPRPADETPLPLTSPTSYTSPPSSRAFANDRQALADQLEQFRVERDKRHGDAQRALQTLLETVLAKYDALVEENVQLRRENQSLRTHLQQQQPGNIVTNAAMTR